MKNAMMKLLMIGLVAGLSQLATVVSHAEEGHDHAKQEEKAPAKAKAEKTEKAATKAAKAHGHANGKGKEKAMHKGCNCDKCDGKETCKEGCGEAGHCGGSDHKH